MDKLAGLREWTRLVISWGYCKCTEPVAHTLPTLVFIRTLRVSGYIFGTNPLFGQLVFAVPPPFCPTFQAETTDESTSLGKRSAIVLICRNSPCSQPISPVLPL